MRGDEHGDGGLPMIAADEITGVSRIAVAADRTPGSDHALRWAIDLASRSGCDLAIVQVLGADQELLIDEVRASMRSHAGGGHEVIVRCGDEVAETLVEVAGQIGADLLVVGNSGMRGRKEFLLGSVANRVTHLAECSVLVVSSNGTAPVPEPETASGPSQRARDIMSILRATVIEWRRSSRASTDDGPVLLRTSLEQLGPTFSKLGQMLSTRPDLIPAEYIAELERLQSNVPPMAEEQVVRLMEQELGVPWEDVFGSIDPAPLAAGTIGQVHRATLADGQRVVVKVQREGIAQLIDDDLRLLETAAETLGRSKRISRVVDLPSVFAELGVSLRAELDFGLEAANLDRMAEIVEPFDRIAVPRPHHRLSTSRLLVMDEVPGVSITQAPRNEASEDAARQLLQCFFAQILEHGFFHADPHPGNLLWFEEKIWLIDLGMVGVLDDEARGRLVLLLLAISRDEIDMLVELTINGAGSQSLPDDLDAYRNALAEIVAELRGRSMAELDLAEFLDRMTRVSMIHGVALPVELLMVGKAIGQVQMTVTTLAPGIDPVQEAGRFVVKSMTSRLTKSIDPQQVMFEVERFHLRIRQLSDAIGSLTGATPGKQLEIGFRSAPVEQAIQTAGRTVGLGLSAGLAWIAASSTDQHGRRGTLSSVATGLTAAFVAEIIRQRRR